MVIARPSLLDGDRKALRQPARPAERLGLVFMKLVHLMVPANLRAVAVKDVARSLIDALKARGPGVHILRSGELQRH